MVRGQVSALLKLAALGSTVSLPVLLMAVALLNVRPSARNKILLLELSTTPVLAPMKKPLAAALMLPLVAIRLTLPLAASKSAAAMRMPDEPVPVAVPVTLTAPVPLAIREMRSVEVSASMAIPRFSVVPPLALPTIVMLPLCVRQVLAPSNVAGRRQAAKSVPALEGAAAVDLPTRERLPLVPALMSSP